MDKIILNKEQLKVLKDYIGSRSHRFKDPVVMLEILDHFACKVEEKMMEGWAFEKAIEQAHSSFGIKGFAPIADHVEQGISKKYRQFRNKEFGKLLLSVHVIGIAAIGVLLFNATQWLQVNILIGQRFSYLIFVLQFLYVGILAFMRTRHTRRLYCHPIFQQAVNGAHASGYLIYFPILFPFAYDGLSTTLKAIIFSILTCVFLANLLVQAKLQTRLAADLDEIDQQYQAIS